jgi:hypothetical protein
MSNRFLTGNPPVSKPANGSQAKAGRRISSWELKGTEISTRLAEQQTPSALQQRLEEILVFELDETGSVQANTTQLNLLDSRILLSHSSNDDLAFI